MTQHDIWDLLPNNSRGKGISGYTAGHELEISEADIDYMGVGYAVLSTFVHFWNFLIEYLIT